MKSAPASNSITSTKAATAEAKRVESTSRENGRDASQPRSLLNSPVKAFSPFSMTQTAPLATPQDSPVSADQTSNILTSSARLSPQGDLFLSGAAASQTHRLNALRNYGDFTLAYNTAVQEHLEYFWYNNGYIAYSLRKGNVFVLGDPVASDENYQPLIDQFLQKYPHATFVQISSKTAHALTKHRFYINEMGIDTTLHLKDYSFAGKAMERIRYASNWLKKRGYQIIEADYKQIQAAEVQAVSDQWRTTRRVRRPEMRFLNRPIRFADELDVRKFFLLDPDGKIVSFFYFDPLYRDGKVIGYATAIKRRHHEAPIYAEQGIMRIAVEQFISEGMEEVKLGLSPLAWLENKTFRCNRIMHYSFCYGFNAWWVNRYFYNLKGHAQYKRHFKGVETPLHYASPVLFNDIRIASLLRLTGVY